MSNNGASAARSMRRKMMKNRDQINRLVERLSKIELDKTYLMTIKGMKVPVEGQFYRDYIIGLQRPEIQMQIKLRLS